MTAYQKIQHPFLKAQRRTGIVDPITRQTASMAFSLDTSTSAVQTTHAENIDVPINPASLSKLTVYMIVMDQIKKGYMRPDEIIKISNRAQKLTGRYSGVGELSVSKCLDALLVHSANDVASSLAEHMAQTEWRFCHEVLNPKCREIGMTHTELWSASGLSTSNMPLTKPLPESVTTTRDIQKLLIHLALNYPEIFDITSKRNVTIGDNTFKNTNPFIGVENVNGMKTGTLEISGHHLIISQKEGKVFSFSLTLGNENKEEMIESALRLLNLNPEFKCACPIQNKPD